MAVQTVRDEKVKLVFENGDKNGKLLMVIITTEVWESQQFRIYFRLKGKNKTSADCVEPIGECVSSDDPDWVPLRLFKPAINQARAIFSDYRQQNKKKALSAQARMF